MRRRRFIQAAGATVAVVASGGVTLSAAEAKNSAAELPAGNHPAPVALPHFPSRLHAFIWRNWPLVPADRLATVIGARRRDVEEMARALGLGAQPRITREQERRSYITIIKRNWHLLPYEQLLTLLGWDAGKLAYTLREDDFLYAKLGSNKPACAPLKFSAENQAEERRALEIGRIVKEQFGEDINSREPLFAFVKNLSAKPGTQWQAVSQHENAPAGLRMCYSYFALYGDPLLEPELDPYPAGYLERLATNHINAVWLQGVLHKLAPFPWAPSLSTRWEERLQNLRRLAVRARDHGISIFLYLNEPRAMPLAFFSERPELKGAGEGDHAALCTSQPQVRDWMREAIATVVSRVPELGGFFTITASENLTNCWSHGGGAGCPRCSKRSPAEVIAEVVGTFAAGIDIGRARSSDQRIHKSLPSLIAWDWGWNDAAVEETIRRLPASCALMSVSEWNLPIDRGMKTTVGEYSISAVGPGPRATRHWKLARDRGLRVLAKVQANNSWEMSAVPYIPALANVAKHAANLRAADVDGVMMGWTLGGYPSPNFDTFEEALRSGAAADSVLEQIATRRVGKGSATAVVQAWQQFSRGFSEFPFHIGVVYAAPLQNGPSNLLWEKPTGHHASMVGFPYDDLAAWRAVYPPETFIAQLEKVADGFKAGLAFLDTARVLAEGDDYRRLIDAESSIARTCEIHFRAVASQVRFVLARDALAKASQRDEALKHIGALEKVIRNELSAATELHRLQQRDSRLGFEASNQYYYVPVDLVEKVINCRDLLDRWLPAVKKQWTA